MHKKQITKNRVRMYDTDAAGILYFAQQYRFSHDAWEEFMRSLGLDFDYFFREADWTMVMIHSSADYKATLRLGDELEVHTWVANLGNTSFTMEYDIFRDGTYVGCCKTVQVTIDKETRKAIPLPSDFRSKLEAYIEK